MYTDTRPRVQLPSEFQPLPSGGRSFYAAVVQAPVYPVMSDDTAAVTMLRNARTVAATVDAIMSIVATPPRLFVFPVLILTGMHREKRRVRVETVAAELPGPAFEPVLDACRRNNCYVATSAQEKVPQLPGKYFNTAFVIGPEGLVLRSPKAQTFSAPDITSIRECYDEYVAVFGESAVYPVAETPIGVLGAMSAHAVLVPEAARLLAYRGAQVILQPTTEHTPIRETPNAVFRTANAFANGVYWLSAGYSREILETESGPTEFWYGGGSAIVGPDGTVEAEMGGLCEGFALARIDLDRVEAARERQVWYTSPASVLYRQMYQSDYWEESLAGYVEKAHQVRTRAQSVS